MDYDDWQEVVYLYTDEYKEQLREEINHLSSQPDVSIEDFHHIDILRPGGLTGLTDFIANNQLTSESKVLEIGSGIGGNCRFLTQRTGCNCYGLDYLQHYVDFSNQISQACKMQDKLEFHQGDATNYNYPQNEFDLVINTGVLFLIPGEEVYQHIFNTLKSGGKFYFEDYVMTSEFPDQMSQELQEIYMKRFPVPGARPLQNLIQLLERLGFIILQTEEMTWLWSENTWAKAEGLLAQYQENPDTQDKIFLSKYKFYGKFTPTILNDLKHITPEELQSRFPNVCSSFDFQSSINNTERDIQVYKIIAQKP